jgi:hypothetical protein
MKMLFCFVEFLGFAIIGTFEERTTLLVPQTVKQATCQGNTNKHHSENVKVSRKNSLKLGVFQNQGTVHTSN